MAQTAMRPSYWGWIIAIAGMFIPSMYAAAQRCFSTFYNTLMNEFTVNYAAVSWLNGLFLAGYGLGSIAVPTLYTRVSYRAGVMVAGLISCVSVFFSSFSGSLEEIVWLAGFVPGLCTAVTTVGIYGSVQNYFARRRNTAMQFLCTGASLGAFVYCPIFQMLIDAYSWRGAFQVIAGFYLQIPVVGSLLRPYEDDTKLSLENKPQHESQVLQMDEVCSIEYKGEIREKNTVSTKNNRVSFIRRIYNESGIGVVLKLKFHLFCWSWIFFAAAYYSSLTYLIPYGKINFEITDVQATTLVSAVSFGEVASRIILASFFDKFDITRRMLVVSIIHLVMACIFAVVPFLNGYLPLLVLCSLVGVGGGGMDAIYAVFTGEIFGSEFFDAVYSYSSVLSFLAGSATTVIFGVAIDGIGEMSVVFYFGAASLVISSVLMMIEACLCRKSSPINSTLQPEL